MASFNKKKPEELTCLRARDHLDATFCYAKLFNAEKLGGSPAQIKMPMLNVCVRSSIFDSHNHALARCKTRNSDLGAERQPAMSADCRIVRIERFARRHSANRFFAVPANQNRIKRTVRNCFERNDLGDIRFCKCATRLHIAKPVQLHELICIHANTGCDVLKRPCWPRLNHNRHFLSVSFLACIDESEQNSYAHQKDYEPEHL